MGEVPLYCGLCTRVPTNSLRKVDYSRKDLGTRACREIISIIINILFTTLTCNFLPGIV